MSVSELKVLCRALVPRCFMALHEVLMGSKHIQENNCCNFFPIHVFNSPKINFMSETS